MSGILNVRTEKIAEPKFLYCVPVPKINLYFTLNLCLHFIVGAKLISYACEVSGLYFDCLFFNQKVYLKGVGGSMTLGSSKSSFLLFPTEGSVSYQMLFTRSKNIVPSRSYRILKS